MSRLGLRMELIMKRCKSSANAEETAGKRKKRIRREVGGGMAYKRDPPWTRPEQPWNCGASLPEQQNV